MIRNIFKNIPRNFSEEIFDTIFQSDSLRIERILSDGQSSPKDFWYNQEENEWVLLLEGEAEIIFDSGENFFLRKGDFVLIPSHQKHRVSFTRKQTIWLAVFYK